MVCWKSTAATRYARNRKKAAISPVPPSSFSARTCSNVHLPLLLPQSSSSTTTTTTTTSLFSRSQILLPLCIHTQTQRETAMRREQEEKKKDFFDAQVFYEGVVNSSSPRRLFLILFFARLLFCSHSRCFRSCKRVCCAPRGTCIVIGDFLSHDVFTGIPIFSRVDSSCGFQCFFFHHLPRARSTDAYRADFVLLYTFRKKCQYQLCYTASRQPWIYLLYTENLARWKLHRSSSAAQYTWCIYKAKLLFPYGAVKLADVRPPHDFRMTEKL